jgi:hypothetical protein
MRSNIFYHTLEPEKGKEETKLGWVSITPAGGPQFGPKVLAISYHDFPSTIQVLHVVSW